VNYTMPKGRVYKTKSKGAQEAHESIRPTSFRRDPDSLADSLKSDELRLYRLIWQRALASQMEAKELETTTAELEAGAYGLRATATRVLFDGFARVYTEGRDDKRDGTDATNGAETDDDVEGRLPPLKEGDETDVRDVTTTQHFTEPPPRFTEASLIKALEDNGIGRPSTYAATISTIVDRGYVRIEERRLHPEPVAGIVVDLLVEHFGDYVDLAFTAKMEEDLDDVASGKRPWVPLLEAFYPPLRERVDEVRKTTRRSDFTTEATDEVCSLGHPMVIRLGRNGRFLACSMYPEHKESRPLPGDEPPAQAGTGETCPKCGLGTLVGKRGRFGPFVGCDRYPDCDYIQREGPEPPAQLPFEVTCPKNNDGRLVARRARRTGNVFWGCSNYPKCDYTTNFEPIGALHDADDGPVAKRGDGFICLKDGAPIEVPDTGSPVGLRLPGGPPDPAALAPARRGRGAPSTGPRRGAGRAGGRRTTRSTRTSAKPRS
jgi:DNA topoisomerase-1